MAVKYRAEVHLIDPLTGASIEVNTAMAAEWMPDANPVATLSVRTGACQVLMLVHPSELRMLALHLAAAADALEQPHQPEALPTPEVTELGEVPA